MELRAVSRKLSSCEQALEGHGAYLGIRDPVRKEKLVLASRTKYSRCLVGCVTGYPNAGYRHSEVACFC